MVAIAREITPTATTPSIDAIPLRLRHGSGSPRQVFALTLVGALVLAAFASRDLTSWLNRLGDGPIVAPLQHAAAEWDDAMATLGLVRPHEALRLAIHRLLEWEWR
jgi:hypothetical protein